ncbi:unnamed protein product [Durusdinium trenchii]|uniref:JmjC domain-containing protein n=1 Tax=Durusdinium trenchii TaxID=1381693 RepID=A0ABP0J0P5_9DINO
MADCRTFWKGVNKEDPKLHRNPILMQQKEVFMGVNSFTFAYDFMHCADIGFSASAVANVFYDICYKHLDKLKKKDRIQKLNQLVTEAYIALNTPHDVRVKRLTWSSFTNADAPHQHYPGLLHSAIKAKQVARLVPVAAKLCKDFHSDTIYCKHRLYCLQSLEKLYNITHNAAMFLTKQEIKDYQAATSRFLRHYECLSKISAASTEKVGQYQWSQIPKMHYQEHISEDCCFLNPERASQRVLPFKLRAHPKSSGIRKQVRRLRQAVEEALKEYLGEESEHVEIAIEASWANVNPACGLNGPHVHPFAALSGAYYVDCGSNATSPTPCSINLMDPRPSAPMAALPAEVRDALDFGIDWTLSLWPGTVLIFPSWLGHWVPPNAAPLQRITISFNAGLKEKMARSGVDVFGHR